jgi:hypothetical protein
LFFEMRHPPSEQAPQNLCLDKGYDNKPGREVVKKHGYKGHIRRIGEEKLDRKGKKKHPARRYVVAKNASLVIQMPGLVGALREEERKLLGSTSVCLLFALVPLVARSGDRFSVATRCCCYFPF